MLRHVLKHFPCVLQPPTLLPFPLSHLYKCVWSRKSHEMPACKLLGNTLPCCITFVGWKRQTNRVRVRQCRRMKASRAHLPAHKWLPFSDNCIIEWWAKAHPKGMSRKNAISIHQWQWWASPRWVVQCKGGWEVIYEEDRANRERHSFIKWNKKDCLSFVSCVKSVWHSLTDSYHAIFHQAVLDLDRAVSWEYRNRSREMEGGSWLKQSLFPWLVLCTN